MKERYTRKAHTIKEQGIVIIKGARCYNGLLLKSCCRNIPARILSLQFYHLLYNLSSRIHSRKSSKSSDSNFIVCSTVDYIQLQGL